MADNIGKEGTTENMLPGEKKIWQLFQASGRRMPEMLEAYYGPVKEAAYSAGRLSVKNKRLQALAIAVQTGCRECMISQTRKALDAGADCEEIFETVAVVISMGGSLAWSHALTVVEYLDEKGLVDVGSEEGKMQ